MPVTRRVARRARFADQAPDDLHWPMDVALIVLGGFLLGVALARLRFDEPQWLLNAWTSLVAMPLLILAGLIASRLASRRWMRRTMQFSLLASMLIHLVLLVAVKQVEMSARPTRRVARNEDVVRRPAKRRTRDFSSYRFSHQGNRRPDFERPVETQAPTPPVELLPQRSSVDQSPVELQPQPVLEPQKSAQPSIVNKQRTVETLPRRSEQPAQLSRNLRPQLAARPQAQPLAEAAATQPAPAASRPEAAATSVDKASTATTAQPARTPEVEATSVPRSTPRRVQSETAITATAPLLERRAAEREPSVAADATPRSAAFQPQTLPRLAPDTAPLERTVQAAPPTQGRADAELREATDVARRAVRRENQVDQQPLAAATPQPTENQQPRRTERRLTTESPQQLASTEPPMAAAARVADPPAASRSPAAIQPDALRPTPAEVARQSVPSSQPVAARQQPAEQPQLSRSLEAARTPSLRVVQSEVPTLNPQARPTDLPQRALRTAATPQTPIAIESPAAQVADPTPASSAPAPTALARSTDGTAGSGYSPNLDRATPAPESPALVASGAAARSRASQSRPEAPDLSPSSRAVIGRSRASAALPGTAAEVSTESVASRPAQTAASQLAASSSASLQEATARADTGSVSAEKGTLQVDIGPSRVVSQLQSGRGAGGGQPELNLAPQQAAPQPARSGSLQAALAVDQTAQAIAAPMGDGGAAPLALDASPVASQTTRTDPGGSSPSTGGPPAAALAGPASEPNAADLAGELALRSAQRSASARPHAADQGRDAPLSEPRAEPVDAAAGEPLAGGGSQSRQRSAVGPELASSATGVPSASLDVPLASTTPRDAPAAPIAAGVALQRQTGGTVLPDGPLNLEAVRSAEPQYVPPTAAADSLRPRQASPDDAEEGSPSDDLALTRQRPAADVVTAANDPLAELRPERPESDSPSPAPAGGLAARELDGLLDRLASSLPVEIDAQPGTGGLAATPATDVGIDDRRASEESLQIQSRIVRFPRRDVGGQAALNPAPVVAAEAFRQRLTRRSDQPGGQPLAPETERAIELGLVYLARQQLEDGRWTLLVPGDERPQMNSDTAATGLALLAFQGAGYTHKQDHYAHVVQAALDMLVASQDEQGCLYLESDEDSNRFARLYSHGIAALAMCEAYGMTQDPELREPAQRAINYIVAAQSRGLGGWRYTPAQHSDTSVSGWMMMALKSGELAGLDIPRETYTGVVSWLDRAQKSDDEPHLYRYNPEAPDTDFQRHGRVPTPTMTAVGLLMRLYLGWNRDDPRMQAGSQYLSDNLPSLGSPADPLLSRRRDTYYWYYATQVMFHMGGEAWREWNARLYPLLINTQIQTGPHAGSWDPIEPVPDRWAGHAGRIYVTTMNLLSLEVHYRHLPLYVETAE